MPAHRKYHTSMRHSVAASIHDHTYLGIFCYAEVFAAVALAGSTILATKQKNEW